MLYKHKLNERRDHRLPHRAEFRLFWDESSCESRYAKAFCNEVSERGLSLETSEPIPVETQLSVRSECGALLGGARVKHVAKRGPNYVLGVQLSYHLLDEALAFVREAYSTSRAQ